ncbi:MAG: hypothetical protein E7290_13760 [Lachnospiraceae bacterium]|nr:hypothetical protein [Lachnospiraceae bacterium]
MKSEMRKALKEAYEAPMPQHKKEFISKLDKPQLSTYSFVLQQTAYIRKRVWILSLFIVAVAIWGTSYVGQDSLWVISSMMPFVALCAITENARSMTYGMAELEMASRFSLKSIMLARIGIIGILHFAVFCILIPFVGSNSLIPFARTGLYLFVPYMLSSTLGLWAVRRFQDIDATYLCMVTSAIVCLLNVILKNIISGYYEEQKVIWWVIAAVYFMVKTWNEYKKTISQTEELLWN